MDHTHVELRVPAALSVLWLIGAAQLTARVVVQPWKIPSARPLESTLTFVPLIVHITRSLRSSSTCT